MPKTHLKSIKKSRSSSNSHDGPYLLKLVLYIILGSMWLKISKDGVAVPVPLGFIIGIIFASHEHFRIDRKIEYAVLIVAMLVGFIAPYGLYISF